MTVTVHGIHHVTCLAGDAQQNIDFYAGVLGMRLVKRSVNQDAPETYHLFYADGAGTPGTDITFFPVRRAAAARAGVGLTMETSLAIPKGNLSYWQARLHEHGVAVGNPEHRFGEVTLPFRDADGLSLALVETDDARPFVPWTNSPVPEDYQIRGIHCVRLWERALEPTDAVLTKLLGFVRVGEEDGWHRYGVDGNGSGNIVEIKAMPDKKYGAWGVGGVHHVAWRTNNTDEEMVLRAAVDEAGLAPSPLIDRFWFQSVYFREPGGVLFELATDGPGFSIDEDPEHLGERLILPPWLESRRERIEAVLPPLTLPDFSR